MRTIKKVLTLTAMAAALQACGGDNEIGPELVAEPSTAAASTAVFDPAAGASGLPFPVDLLFSGTADGSVNIPGKPNSLSTSALFAALATPDGGADEGALITTATSTPAGPFLADPQTALNTMDGFSTTAPMVVRFSDDIDDPADPDDIKDNVRIFRLTTADAGANGTLTVDAELTFGVDFAAGVSGGTSMLIQPLKPLEPGRTHVVVIENGLKTTGGNPVAADDTYRLLQGSFLLVAGGAMTLVSGEADFVLQGDGTTSCDLTSPSGVAACTDVNTEDYQLIVDNVPDPTAQAGAASIVGALTQLEGAGQVSTLIQLEQLRRIAAKHLTAVAGAGVAPQDVVLSYSITTENVDAALAQAKAKVDGLVEYDFPPATLAAAPTIDVLNPKQDWDDGTDPLPYEVQSPQGAADIFLANMNGLLQFVDPDAPNSSVWEAVANSANWAGVLPCTALPAAATGSSNLVGCNGYNPAPKVIDHSIPVLISVPSDAVLATCPAGDLPAVIYQHGITSSRGSLMAIADTLASQCVIGVAIDLPKHGIVPTGDTFSQLSQLHQGLQQIPAPNPTPVLERLVQTANPAVECQATTGVAIGGASADFYCPSGDNFINLTNLANARDSLRQAVVDLNSLYRALANNDTSNDLTTATIGRRIDVANINFVGVSLGGIVGTPFVAQQGGNLATATLNVTGGGIAKILDGSPQIEPTITTGLYEAAGLAKPGGDYEGFLIIAQTMVDNVDPINYATDAAGTGTPILAQEVIGNPADNITCLVDGTGCPDQVVPNNVFGASFGPAWGLVAQTGQTSYLANQNFITTPVGLAGTDPLTQGTGFVVGGTVAASMPSLAGDVIGAGPLGGDSVMAAVNAVAPGTFPAGAVTFKGLGLPLVTECGASGTSGVVRFTSGDHSSLLNPAADALVTGVMQKQMATFIVSGGALVADDTLASIGGASAGVVFTPTIPSASTAACAP